MKKLLTVLALGILALTLSLHAADSSCSEVEVVDEYELVMKLKVPRTYDNMQSLGYRKLQYQKVVGTLRIVYSGAGTGYGTYLEVTNLVNQTHKLSNGQNVTYQAIIGADGKTTRIGYIGNNRTGVFTKPFLSFSMDCNPSYNIGEDEPDNALIINLSGYGTSALKNWEGYRCRIIKRISGKLAGDLGCGCTAYGHKSCTRTAAWYGPTDEATDVAPVDNGVWYIKWKRRYMRDFVPKDDDYWY